MSENAVGIYRIGIFVLLLITTTSAEFQPILTTGFPSQSYLSETIRILSLFVDTVVIQCPSVSKANGQPVRFEELFWINENNDHLNPDSSVLISSANLIDKAQLTVRINQQVNYLSCGYLYDNKYVRIKLWTFNYVDVPDIQLKVVTNPSSVSYKPINSSFSSISVPSNANVATWQHPLDLIRIKCQTNYDIPLDTRYVWMYYKNPNNGIVEIWHRDDVRGVEDPLQIFMYDLYNSVANRNESLSKFIGPLLLGRVDKIDFQCASYKDSFKLLAKSSNFTLIRGSDHSYTNPPYYTTAYTTTGYTPIGYTTTGRAEHYNNGPLIGGIIGGILGLLLLLALILLLIWCCCIRRSKDKESSKVYYNQQNLASQSAVSGYPVENQIEITQDGWRNMASNSAAYIHYPTQSTHTLDKHSSRYQSHVEVNNLNQNHQQVVSSSNLSNHHMGQNGIATVRSEVPDVYLKTITLPKDVNDESYLSTYTQKDITYNTNNGYLTDEEFHASRREYFVNNSSQQQNHHHHHHESSETRFQYV